MAGSIAAVVAEGEAVGDEDAEVDGDGEPAGAGSHRRSTRPVRAGRRPPPSLAGAATDARRSLPWTTTCLVGQTRQNRIAPVLHPTAAAAEALTRPFPAPGVPARGMSMGQS